MSTPSPAVPSADTRMLLDLTLRDSVAETVAVEAVVHTLRDLGLETAVLDSLATVLTQILREAREREVFADDPPLVRVTLGLDPPHILLRVSDTRMPVWAKAGAPRHSDELAVVSPLAGYHRGEQVGGGNWVECVLNLRESGEGGPSMSSCRQRLRPSQRRRLPQ